MSFPVDVRYKDGAVICDGFDGEEKVTVSLAIGLLQMLAVKGGKTGKGKLTIKRAKP